MSARSARGSPMRSIRGISLAAGESVSGSGRETGLLEFTADTGGSGTGDAARLGFLAPAGPTGLGGIGVEADVDSASPPPLDMGSFATFAFGVSCELAASGPVTLAGAGRGAFDFGDLEVSQEKQVSGKPIANSSRQPPNHEN